MNLANKLTMFRFILVPFFLIFISLNSEEFKYSGIIAFLIFVIASLTDMLDGYIARSRNLITDFGKFMDPLADKVLTTAAFIVLVDKHYIASWIVVAILFREYAVTGMRTLGASSGKVIAASNYGKIKTIFQLITLSYMLLINGMVNIFGEFSIQQEIEIVGQILVYITLIVTIGSGIDYFNKNKELIKLDM